MNLRTWIVSFSVVFAASSVRSAEDLQIAKAPPADEFQIVLSSAGVKRAERRTQWELYRRAVAGNEDAQAAWRELKPKARTDSLAALAQNKEEDKELRKHALRDLALMPSSEDAEETGLAALSRNAVMEPSGELREYARQGLAARNDPRAIPPLADALANEDGLVRANAALALKAIGGPRVFEVIIEHWKETWGPGPRSHVFLGQQRSYVSGYNITGDSYEPVVSSLMTGVVLDAKSLRVEGDSYYLTIREIAPGDAQLPNNPAAWKEWLEKERPKLAREAAKKHSAAVALLSGTDDE